MKSNRVAVIGLDGVSFNTLYNILNHGLMPSLKSVLNRSLVKVLESILPPYTPPAWTSIATGVNPGKHGIFDFHVVKKADTGFISRIAVSMDVMYPRIYEMLLMHKLRSIIFNLPLTYPPWHVGSNCIIINDWMAPEIRIHPRDLENRFIGYFNKGLEALDMKGSSDKSFDIMAERVGLISTGLLEIMDRFEWNLLFMVFSETDWCMHGNDKIVRGEIPVAAQKIFRNIDYFIKEVIKRSDAIIIVSDHGMTLCEESVNIPYILRRHGLMEAIEFRDIIEIRLLGTKIRVPRLVARLARGRMRTLLRRFAMKIGGDEARSRHREIPYKLTKVLMPDAGVIYVAPGYKDIIKRILLKDPYIKSVYECNEIYWGPYAGLGPDLIVEPVKDYCTGISYDEYVSKNVTTHCRDGIFILYPRDYYIVRASADKMRLWDVAPLILQLFNLPIPHDTDSNLPVVVEGYRLRKMNYRDPWIGLRRVRSMLGR